MEIIKKAWKVWHEGMLDENPLEGYSMETLPVIYANTEGEAKAKLDLHEYNLKNGQSATFLDVRARRSEENDKIMFEGSEVSIAERNRIVHRRRQVQTRIEMVNKYPDDAMFYVQNGFMGNVMVFWGLGSCGYFTNIEKCQKYTKAEILKDFANMRDTEVIWPAEHIEASLIKVAHSSKINSLLGIK